MKSKEPVANTQTDGAVPQIRRYEYGCKELRARLFEGTQLHIKNCRLCFRFKLYENFVRTTSQKSAQIEWHFFASRTEGY